MLPFMKNKHEASMSGEDEPITRKPDEDKPFDMLDAVAGDLMDGLHKKDVKLIKSALEALCEHIQDMDQAQDESLTHEEV